MRAVLETVHVPPSVDEVVLSLRDGAVLMAGGTTVMPRVNTMAVPFTDLVSLRRSGLSGIDVEAGVATVGATTTIAEIGADARLAFLRPVVDSFASPPLRNLATIGGNLFVPQPGGDFAVCLLALDATAVVCGRETGIAEVLEDGVAADEIVTAVRFRVPAEGTFFYRKAMRRRYNSAAIVSVAAVVVREGGLVRSARIALGGAGSRPVRAKTAEYALVGKPLDEASVAAAATGALADATTFDDAFASAWYRARVLPVHVRRALLGG